MTPRRVERREHGRPRADDDVDVAAPDAVPLIVALAVGQPAVLDRDAARRTRREQRGHRRRERDLGDHEQRLAAGAAHAIRQPQVDLGLAAAGHAVQQRHAELARVGERCELLERLRPAPSSARARWTADVGAWRRARTDRARGLGSQRDEPARGEPADHVRGDARDRAARERQPVALPASTSSASAASGSDPRAGSTHGVRPQSRRQRRPRASS